MSGSRTGQPGRSGAGAARRGRVPAPVRRRRRCGGRRRARRRPRRPAVPRLGHRRRRLAQRKPLRSGHGDALRVAGRARAESLATEPTAVGRPSVGRRSGNGSVPTTSASGSRHLGGALRWVCSLDVTWPGNDGELFGRGGGGAGGIAAGAHGRALHLPDPRRGEPRLGGSRPRGTQGRPGRGGLGWMCPRPRPRSPGRTATARSAPWARRSWTPRSPRSSTRSCCRTSASGCTPRPRCPTGGCAPSTSGAGARSRAVRGCSSGPARCSPPRTTCTTRRATGRTRCTWRRPATGRSCRSAGSRRSRSPRRAATSPTPCPVAASTSPW